MDLNENFAEIIVKPSVTNSGIVELILNRPNAANAINGVMVDEICRFLELADQDAATKVIIISGSGKHFCAGGDVKAMKNKTGMFAGDTDTLRKKYAYGIQNIARTMERIETPVIAAINGAAIGAGLDLACMCDIRLASQNAKFGETFTRLGLISGDGGSFFLQRVVGYPLAMELTLTAEIIDSKRALEIGLVSKLVDLADLASEALILAEKIARQPSVATKYAKRLVRDGFRSQLNQHLELASVYQGVTQRTPDHFNALAELEKKD